MRRGLLLVPVALLAGCGGGADAVELKDARPCLDKLALVVVSKPPPGVTLNADAPDNASLSFKDTRAGANAANVTFYDDEKSMEAQIKLTRESIARGNVFGVRAPQRVGDFVTATFSSPPTKRQVARVKACVS